MNREINRIFKFRAWIELLGHEDEYPKKGSMYYWKLNFQSNGGERGIKNGTVMQYTGLKDKNGKEGAFNDIVKFTYIYSKGYGKEIKEYYTGEIKENKFFHSCIMVGDREFHIDNLKNGEIIENIHENKELIK